MKLETECLGKVAITVEEDYWSKDKSYERLTVVEVKDAFATYISRKDVPVGIEITDRSYWIPFSSLQESIVLDYTSFINKYSDILTKLINANKNLESRVDRLDDLKEYNKKLIDLNNKLNSTINGTYNEVKRLMCQAQCVLRKVDTYIKAMGFKQIGDTLYISDETLNVRHIPKSRLQEILV